MLNDRRVCVVGLGYIGLPTAAVLASRGFHVVGVDINAKAVDTINRGEVHIVEPELDVLVHGAVASKRLRASLTPEEADVFLVAVPTPFKDGHKPDLSYIEAAGRSIAPFLRKGSLLILESTSPVGTTRFLSTFLGEIRSDLRFPSENANGEHDVCIAYCPERVLPGKVVKELVENDRVIGGIGACCRRDAGGFYRSFVQGACVETSAETAEMCKLTENAFRDVNIAFANELSIVCDRLGVNVWELIRLANRHPRVNILNPGPGVGGHCIAVDPWFIVDSAPDVARLIRTAREVNDGKPQIVLRQVLATIRSTPAPVVACLGLAFKADIDDLRESPALHIVEALAREADARLLVVEPYIEELPESLKCQGVRQVDLQEAMELANIVVGLVDHAPFKGMDRRLLERKAVIDSRGIWQ